MPEVCTTFKGLCACGTDEEQGTNEFWILRYHCFQLPHRASGYCLFIAFAVIDIPEGLEGVVESLNGVLGANLTVADVAPIGKSIIDTELEFNKKAGFTPIHDRLPEFFMEEKLPPHNTVFDVSDDDLDSVF